MDIGPEEAEELRPEEPQQAQAGTQHEGQPKAGRPELGHRVGEDQLPGPLLGRGEGGVVGQGVEDQKGQPQPTIEVNQLPRFVQQPQQVIDPTPPARWLGFGWLFRTWFCQLISIADHYVASPVAIGHDLDVYRRVDRRLWFGRWLFLSRASHFRPSQLFGIVDFFSFEVH